MNILATACTREICVQVLTQILQQSKTDLEKDRLNPGAMIWLSSTKMK